MSRTWDADKFWRDVRAMFAAAEAEKHCPECGVRYDSHAMLVLGHGKAFTVYECESCEVTW